MLEKSKYYQDQIEEERIVTKEISEIVGRDVTGELYIDVMKSLIAVIKELKEK